MVQQQWMNRPCFVQLLNTNRRNNLPSLQFALKLPFIICIFSCSGLRFSSSQLLTKVSGKSKLGTSRRQAARNTFFFQELLETKQSEKKERANIGPAIDGNKHNSKIIAMLLHVCCLCKSHTNPNNRQLFAYMFRTATS